MTVTTFLGGLVSDVLVLHLAAAAVVAAVCGFVGAAGPRAAMVGVLSLVCFTIFSGSPVILYDSLVSAALVAIGGLIQMPTFANGSRACKPRARAPPVITRLRSITPCTSSSATPTPCSMAARDEDVSLGSSTPRNVPVAR